jgi:hypothetical protein
MVICLPQRPQCRGRPSSSLTVGIEPENVDGHGGGRDLTHNPVSRANGPASERLTSSLTVARDLGNAGLHSGGPPLTRTEEVMGRPRHRVESQVSCPKPFRLATAAQSPGHGPRRVQNPCPKSTSHNQPCQGFCDAPCMGHLLGYASASHHRPATPAPGRRPPARRLLSGVHRDRQRRPQRPPRPRLN